MSEHEHTEACGSTPETDGLLARLNDPSKKLTLAQFRELRGKYFTVRHVVVPECQHKIDMINEPRHRNCETCWWAWLSAHGELVKVTDEAFQEHGPAFIDKLRGVTYRKNFTRYMSTLAAFKLEADAMAEQTRALDEKAAQGRYVSEENQSREITNSEELVSKESLEGCRERPSE